jgi:hypothetical protein
LAFRLVREFGIAVRWIFVFAVEVKRIGSGAMLGIFQKH